MLKVGPYALVETVVKLVLVMLLAGCTSENAGAALDFATDDFHRLGEVAQDMSGGDDLAALDAMAIETDMATTPDLAQPSDMAAQADLNNRPDLLMCLVLGTSCHAGDTCCAGQCGFSGVGSTNDTCCVGIGQPCTRLGDCCSPYTCKLVMGAFTCNP